MRTEQGQPAEPTIGTFAGDVLFMQDVAAILRTSRSTIERRRRSGTFPMPALVKTGRGRRSRASRGRDPDRQGPPTCPAGREALADEQAIGARGCAVWERCSVPTINSPAVRQIAYN